MDRFVKISSVWSINRFVDDSWYEDSRNSISLGLYATREAAEKAAEIVRQNTIMDQYGLSGQEYSRDIDLKEIDTIVTHLHPELSEPMKEWLSDPSTTVTSEAFFDKIFEIAESVGGDLPKFEVREVDILGEECDQI